jgi:peptidoglycan/xylan/chitin deacetylase (PgdA/CDA1 family)
MNPLSLEYHDVVEADAVDGSGFAGAGPASYKLERGEFERHLARIAARARRRPGRVTDWVLAPTASAPLFLTFDDGGVSAHTMIADALEQHGWRGHFFVTAGRIGSPTFVSPEQMRDLHRRGHVIGTHSYSHPARMGACSPAEIRDEWRRSIGILADALGEPITCGSVPGGFYAKPVGEAASEAGLTALFTSRPTTRPRREGNCILLGRYTLRRWSSAETAAALARGAWKPRAAQWVLYSGLNAARTVAGPQYTRLRQAFWRNVK